MSALVLLLENLLFPFGALAIVARFLLSPRRKVLLSLADELRERFGGVAPETILKLKGRKLLWVHAASAGEVAAVSGLIETVKKRENAPAVILTTTTMTGREKAAALPHADAAALAPLDCWPAVSRFLSALKPSALLLVETELWPQTIALASRRGVRVALVNGRMTERSFGRYRLFSAFARPFLGLIDRFCLQSEADAQRFRALGAPAESVLVAGNMKYDRMPPSRKDPEVSARLVKMGWGADPIWVCGSTHPVEEETLVRAFKTLREKFPALKLVLAPRHPERASAALKTLIEAKLDAAPWSEASSTPKDALVLDGLGVLPKLYAFASISFVGGTLVPVGGHNLLEPAMAGSPVLFGPRTEHIREVARLLESAGCGFCVEDESALAARLTDLLSDDGRRKALGAQARKLAEGLQGAVDRTLSQLALVLAS